MTYLNPIQAHLTESGLMIDCLFAYNPRALRPMKEAEGDLSWAHAIEAGIRQHWTGSWPLSENLVQALDLFCKKRQIALDLSTMTRLAVGMTIRREETGALTPGLLTFKQWLARRRRPARIYVRPSLILPAHVASPLHRRFWGIFRSGQLESIGLNWSPSQPGYMVVPSQTPGWRLAGLAAHEAGHLFGLGDAYDAWYRFYAPAAGTEAYMMRANQRVQTEELAMLIRAQATGRMQYFPRQFRLRTILAGLGTSFKRLLGKIRPKGNA